MSIDITAVRAYDDDQPAGYRVLVDRLWPRGVAKENLDHDEWDKQSAPSSDLRKRFHGGELNFHNFELAYRKELQDSGAPDALLDRFAESGKDRLVLLYSGTNREQNNALVLADVLRERTKDRTTTS